VKILETVSACHPILFSRTRRECNVVGEDGRGVPESWKNRILRFLGLALVGVNAIQKREISVLARQRFTVPLEFLSDSVLGGEYRCPLLNPGGLCGNSGVTCRPQIEVGRVVPKHG